MDKECLDRLDILQKADIIKIRAKEIVEKNRTISKKKAYEIAAKELLKNKMYY